MLITSPELTPITQPLIFLAGPIQGAPDWQARAAALIAAEAPDCDIASPRRQIEKFAKLNEAEYLEQVQWEHRHLAAAAKSGVILFWLAAEDHIIEGRSYAQTTRFELGEAVTEHRLAGTKVVVGFEQGFSNAKYLRYTLAKKAPGIMLCDTLEDTCRQAVALARGA